MSNVVNPNDIFYSPSLKASHFVQYNYGEIINADKRYIERVNPESGNYSFGGEIKYKIPVKSDHVFSNRVWIKGELNALASTGVGTFERLDKPGFLSIIDYITINSGSVEIAKIERDSLVLSSIFNTDNEEFNNLFKNQVGWEDVDGTRTSKYNSAVKFLIPLHQYFAMFGKAFPLFLVKNESLEIRIKLKTSDCVQTDGTLTTPTFVQAETELLVEMIEDRLCASIVSSKYQESGWLYWENNYITEEFQDLASGSTSNSRELNNIADEHLQSFYFVVRANSDLQTANDYDITNFVAITDFELNDGNTPIDNRNGSSKNVVNYNTLIYPELYRYRNQPYILNKNVYTISYAQSNDWAHPDKSETTFSYQGSVQTAKFNKKLLKISHASLGAVSTLTCVYHTLHKLAIQPNGYVVLV